MENDKSLFASFKEYIKTDDLSKKMFVTKTDIQGKLKDVDSIFPKVDENEAIKILSTIRDIESGVNDEYYSLQDLYDSGIEQNKWIAEYGQATEGQLRSTEGVINANKKARQSVEDYNLELKNLTIGAKAATVASKVLATAMNMFLSMAISFAITKIVEAISNYVNRVKIAREKTLDLIQTYEDISAEITTLSEKIDELDQQLAGLNSITDAEDIENIKAETAELETQLAILREKQRLAGENADEAAVEYLNMTQSSKYEDDGEYAGVKAQVTPTQELYNAMSAYDKNKQSAKAERDKLAELAESGDYSQEKWKRHEDLANYYDELAESARTHANELAVSISEQKEALNGSSEESELHLIATENVLEKYAEFTDRLEVNTKAIEDNTEAKQKNNSVKMSFKDYMSNLNQLADGLDQLDKIYADVKDGEDFDYSSILGNEDFKETFSGFEDEYNNFIKTVSNSPKDIGACQQAFNDLATAYIYSQDTLSNVTEETKESAIQWLKQKGIANAQAIVERQLANNTEGLAKAQKELNAIKEKGIGVDVDLENATLEEIKAIIDEAEAADLSTAEITEYILQKINANQVSISTDGDIKALIAFCEGLEISTSAMQKYATAKEILNDALRDVPLKYEDIVKYDNYSKVLDEKIAAEKSALTNELRKLKGVYANYNGGVTSNKDSGSSGSQTEEEIDHIATKIERLEREIESLGKTAGATYETWADRNKALSSQISKTTEEIALQEQALAYYQKKANSVGLSKEYQDLVKYGGIRVDTITDEKLAEKIQKYQEWYDKILSCEDAIEDLNTELASLAKQKFDNISSEFDNKMSTIEHEMEVLEAYIDQTETRGHIVSTKYYESLIEAQKKNLQLLEQEYAQLNEELSNAMETGDIKHGSEDWYAMKDSINAVKMEIIEANTELVEFGNSIRDLEWENFDRLNDKISAITEEAEFLISLMEDSELYDDKGQLTDTGIATMGLHAQSYNVLMNQADRYAEEVEKINEQLANDPNNQELLDRKKELIELQRESILAANDEKMAIKDMVEEGVSLELEALQELIDAYNEALDAEKELYDYQKNVASQTKEIAALQKQLAAFQGDNSEENKARIQQIKVSLEEAQDNLEQTEYEFYISEQKKLLDELYESYDKILNERLDNIDALLADMIAEVNNNASSINATLNEQTEAVGAKLSENMQSIWSNDGLATGIITKYGDNFNSQLTSVNHVLNAIAQKMGAIVEDSDKEADKVIKEELPKEEPKKPETKPEPTPTTPSTETKPAETTKEIKVGGKIDAGNAKIYDYAGDTTGETQYYKKDPKYIVLKEKDGYLQVRHHSLSKGITGWFKKKDVKAYKTGGLNEETGLAWLDGTKSKPEMVLNAKDTQNFMELTELLRQGQANKEDSILFGNTKLIESIEELSSYLRPEFDVKKFEPIRTEGFSGGMNNVFNMNFELHEVQNGRDVVNFLIKDKTFENAIQAMTVDRLAGGSKFAKSKYYKG